MKYKAINSDLFIHNRSLLAKKLKENSIAIFNSNDIMPTNSDGTMPFKQNSDLFWLTGVDQEESLFAMIKKNGKIDELLFVKETNEHIAIWEGAKLSKDDATKTSGIKNVYWLSDIEKFLWDKILDTQFLFLNKNIHSRATSLVQTRDDRFREQIIKKFPALRKFSFDGKLSKIKKVNKNNKVIIILVVVFENINIQDNNKK